MDFGLSFDSCSAVTNDGTSESGSGFGQPGFTCQVDIGADFDVVTLMWVSESDGNANFQCTGSPDDTINGIGTGDDVVLPEIFVDRTFSGFDSPPGVTNGVDQEVLVCLFVQGSYLGTIYNQLEIQVRVSIDEDNEFSIDVATDALDQPISEQFFEYIGMDAAITTASTPLVVGDMVTLELTASTGAFIGNVDSYNCGGVDMLASTATTNGCDSPGEPATCDVVGYFPFSLFSSGGGTVTCSGVIDVELASRRRLEGDRHLQGSLGKQEEFEMEVAVSPVAADGSYEVKVASLTMLGAAGAALLL